MTSSRNGFTRSVFVVSLLLFFAFHAAAQSAESQFARQKYVPGHVLVKFRQNARSSSIQAAHSAVGGEVVHQFVSVEGLQLIHISTPANLSKALASYRGNPNVVYAEPDYVVHSNQAPNDPLFPQMWSLHNTGQHGGTAGADIHAEQAWDITTGSSNVVIAVIDTGIDYNHPDLAANIFSGPICPNRTVCHGINTLPGATNPNDPLDDNGHGTHVSGTIGAIGNNNLGVTGINWTVTILPCKFLDFQGFGATSGAIACLDFIKQLKDSGVNVVASNNSWGGADFSQALQDAIDRQRQSGILFIAAAGNDFADNDVTPTYPASFPLPNVIAVAATDRNDNRAFFSNVGRHSVHLGAPGQEILSTFLGGGYQTESGTSMATPHVTGVAALLAAQDPTRGWQAIKNLILAGGDTISSLSSTISGKRLNAFGSLNCANTVVASRLAPENDVTAGAAGIPIPLSALNINCAQPNGPVTVTVSPGGQVITLADDGFGDGIYTGQFIPPAVGVYTLSYSTGDTATVQVLLNYQAAPTASNYATIAGTNLSLGDDGVAQITSPFPIAFGGGSFTQLWVNANGTISFNGAFSSYLNVSIPTGTSARPVPLVHANTLVAPFWDDLLPLKGTAQNVFWDVTGSAPNRQLVVEWRDVRAFDCAGENDTIRFEVVFFEDSSNILFNYSDAVFGGSCSDHDRGGLATEGIQVSENVGTMWGFGKNFSTGSQDVNDGMSILWQTFSTPPGTPPTPVLTSISPSIVNLYGPAFVLTLNGANFVPQSRVVSVGRDRATTFLSSTQLQAFIPASDLNPFLFFPSELGYTVLTPGAAQVSQTLTLPVSFPAPTISALSPASTPANGLSLVLTITGVGFAPFPNVIFNGQRLTTGAAASPTEVTVIIPGNLLLTPGSVNVQVINTAGPPSSPATFTIAVPSGASNPPVATSRSFLVGSEPMSPPKISIPSKNLPGRFLGWNYTRQQGLDYLKHFVRPFGTQFTAFGKEEPGATAAANTQALVAATPPLPGFDLRTPSLAGFLPTNVAVGDFNHDGHLDWVVCNGGTSDLWVYLGNGDGTSQPPRIIPLTGQAPLAVAAVDLRGTGVLDLVVAEADSLTVGVLLGNGDGTFGPENLYFAPGPPLSLAVTDFNGDGHPDVVVGLLGTEITGAVAFLAGDGTGKLGPPVFSPLIREQAPTTQVINLAIGDINKDGIPDLLVSDIDPEDQGAFVYIGKGDGTFKKGQNLGGSFNGALGDLNGDGCLDAVTLDIFGIADVLLGNCDGTFQVLQPNFQFGEGEAGYGMALVDVNGDGKLDLVTSGIALFGTGGPFGGQYGGMLSVQLGDGTGAFSSPRVYRGFSGMFGMAIADFNGDGHPDVVAASQDTDSVSVFLNNGSGGFGGPQGTYVGWNEAGTNLPGGTANAPNAVFAGDLDANGSRDLLFTDLGQFFDLPMSLATSLNDGAGNFLQDFKSPALDGTVQFFGNLVLGDFRNTGRLDAVLTPNQFSGTFSAQSLVFVPNLGGGHFGAPKNIPIAEFPAPMAAGDFNGDGKLDVVMAGTNGASADQISVFFGNNDGSFTAGPTQLFAGGSLIEKVFVGDFNGDHKLDLLVPVTVAAGRELLEFLGNGDGTFASPRVVLGPFLSFSDTSLLVGVADLNHDGRTDLVQRNGILDNPTATFSVFLAQPDGSFTLQNNYSPYSGEPLDSGDFLADFNGDGNLDIAAFQRQFGQTYVQFLLGNGDGTFTPTFNKFFLSTGTSTAVPVLAVDMNGDGRADLVELDGFVSSFHVIHSAPGTSLRLQFLALPIIGTTGHVRVSVAVPTVQDTVVQLSASDSNITPPPSVTIKAGALSQDFTLQVGAGFDPSRGFTITAQSGGETTSAQAFVAIPGVNIGLGLSSALKKQTVVAGQNTADYLVAVFSIGGYQTTANVSCVGLPAGATCQFGTTSFVITPGALGNTSLIVATSSSLAVGNYPFQVQVSDGTVTQTISLTLSIGDFTISASDTKIAVPGGFVSSSITITSVNGLTEPIFINCAGLPAGVSCNPPGFILPPGQANVGLGIDKTVAPGNYSFSITGANGGISHNAKAVLHVGDFGNTTISATSATLSVGQSVNFTLTVNSINGFNGSIQFGCSPNKNGTTCAFAPSSGSFANSASVTTQLTVAAVSRPAFASTKVAKTALRPIFLWPSLLVAGILLLPTSYRFPAGQETERQMDLIRVCAFVAVVNHFLWRWRWRWLQLQSFSAANTYANACAWTAGCNHYGFRH